MHIEYRYKMRNAIINLGDKEILTGNLAREYISVVFYMSIHSPVKVEGKNRKHAGLYAPAAYSIIYRRT